MSQDKNKYKSGLIIDFERTSFKCRFLKRFSLVVLFFVFISIVVTLFNKNAPLWFIISLWSITSLYFVIHLVINFKESKYYIYRIELDNQKKNLRIYYQIFDGEYQQVEIAFDNLTLQVFNNGFGLSGIFGWKIKFFNNREAICTQFSVGKWTPNIMEEFKKTIELLKSDS